MESWIVNYLGLLPGIEFYDDKKSNTDLESLAVKCSSYSHLWNYPNITDEHISKIYTQWLRNSIHGADPGNVLVALVNDKIIGMTTYSFHAMGGRINFVSVSSDVIKKGWGLKLVKSVQSVLVNRCLTLDVITQSSNIAARMLYEKCGFKITQLYNIFHFWLWSLHNQIYAKIEEDIHSGIELVFWLCCIYPSTWKKIKTFYKKSIF